MEGSSVWRAAVRGPRCRSHRADECKPRYPGIRLHQLAPRISAMMLGCRRAAAGTASLWLMLSAARTEPWLPPGDPARRSDMQLLSDAGIVHGPVTTWPLSWPDIARDVMHAEEGALDPSTASALMRVRRLARRAATSGPSGAGIRLSGAFEPSMLRE